MKIFLLFVSIICCLDLIGQNTKDSIFDPSIYSTYNKNKHVKEHKKNIIFLGLLGNGIVYAICFERKLYTTKTNQTINANIGYGVLSDFKILPFQLNKTFGKQRRFEYGVGATYYIESGIESNKRQLFPTIQAALRFESRKNPMYIKLGLTKFLFIDDNFRKYLSPVYPGLNIGYRF